MAGSVALAAAVKGGAVAWVVPTYRNARPVWRFIERHAARHCDVRRSEMTAQFRRGHLTVYTADNDTSIRGEAFDLVIVDEAAQVREETWTDVLMPTLADREGRAMLISTPKGRNWFWREWQRGKADGQMQAAFSAPSSANPMPSIRRAAELARERVSERTYRQEWLAEFVEDGGGVFRGARAASVLKRIEPESGAMYLCGVDWGRSNDATVISVWNMARGEEVALDRFTGVPFSLQYERVANMARKYNHALIVPEANAAQDAHAEALQRMGLRVVPFITTQASKMFGVDKLAGALERGEARIQDDDEGILQMEAFESTRTASGLVRYAAPSGMHDDIPMARIIAYSGLTRGKAGF